MKKVIMYLMVLVLMGSFLAVPVAAWDVDEVYEHNRRVRAELEALEMCDDMRAFFTMPLLDFSSYVSRNRLVGVRILDEFPVEIDHKALEITEGIYCDYEKARVISFWVGSNITSSFQGVEFTGALAVLQNRQALCRGFTNLTIALLRSVGIPATYVRGTGHAWVEAFVDDRWIIIDPTSIYAVQDRAFDESLAELSHTLKYADIYIPLLVNGLIIDEESGSVLISVGDTSTVTEIIIPEGLTILDDTLRLQSPDVPDENRHLRPFPHLQRLVFPEGFTNLNTAVFSQSDLSEVALPESLDRIGPNAFEETGLAEIAFPNNLRFIGERAFAETNLSIAIFPDSLATVRGGAFDNAGLYVAYIPPTTTDINSTAFNNNPFLTIYGHQGTAAESFALHNGIPIVAVENFEIAGDFALDGNTLLFPMFDRDEASELAIPYGITAIAKNAFRYFTSLTEFSVPDNIESIGDGAFAGSINLEAVYIPPGVTSIGNDVFEGISRLTIYGQSGTAAEAHANEHNITFVNATALGEPVAVADVVEDAPVLEMPQSPEPAQDNAMLFIIGGSILAIIAIFLIVIIKTRKRK